MTLASCDGGSSPPAGDVPIIRDTFQDDFESAQSESDLFPLDGSGWTGRQRVPETNGIDLTAERSRSGRQSMRFRAAPTADGATSKADLVLERFDLAEGDRVWFEFWIYVVGGTDTRNVFVWDLEAPETCTDETSCPSAGDGSICPSPGRRLFLGGAQGGEWTSDLGKWCRGDPFRAGVSTLVTDRWVRLRIAVDLSSDASGRFRVWQDDAQVLDATGITLPRPDARYSRLQIGITANGNEQSPNELFLDDVTVTLSDPGW